MFGHRSLYHDGWRAVCPYPGPSFKEATVSLGTPIDEKKLRELDATGWELYNLNEDYSETKNLAGNNRDKADRNDRHVVRGSRQVQRTSSRLARPTPNYGSASSNRGRSHQLHLLSEHANGADQCWSEYSGPTSQHNGGRRYTQRRRARRPDVHRRRAGRRFLISARRETALCLHLRRSQFFHIESNTPVPEGRHKLRYEFEVTGKPDVPNGKGAPGRSNSTSTASWWARATSLSPWRSLSA